MWKSKQEYKKNNKNMFLFAQYWRIEPIKGFLPTAITQTTDKKVNNYRLNLKRAGKNYRT